MNKIAITWRYISATELALVFDEPALAAFTQIAKDRGLDTKMMIAEAVAELLGTVMMRPRKR